MDRRFVLSSLIAALACAGCGVTESRTVGVPSPDPVRLLAERPALPVTYMTEDGPQSIDWGKEPGDGPAELRICEDGEGAFRSWSEGGVEWAVPSVAQTVCAFETEKAALDTYASQSLLAVGGEDWPNFETGSGAETVPSGVNSLDVLGADEWEIGCGIGEPDSGCAVWTFRARYGQVLAKVEFVAAPGSIRFEQMPDLVKSIDTAVGADS